jgi:hypothetical protein
VARVEPDEAGKGVRPYAVNPAIDGASESSAGLTAIYAVNPVSVLDAMAKSELTASAAAALVAHDDPRRRRGSFALSPPHP